MEINGKWENKIYKIMHNCIEKIYFWNLFFSLRKQNLFAMMCLYDGKEYIQ